MEVKYIVDEWKFIVFCWWGGGFKEIKVVFDGLVLVIGVGVKDCCRKKKL